jgi:hypothetical protein
MHVVGNIAVEIIGGSDRGNGGHQDNKEELGEVQPLNGAE